MIAAGELWKCASEIDFENSFASYARRLATGTEFNTKSKGVRPFAQKKFVAIVRHGLS